MFTVLAVQVWWFRSYSIWQQEWIFAADGYPTLYTLMRIIHGIWLWILATAVGLLVLRPFMRQQLGIQIGALPAMLVATFAGLAAIRLFIFPLGLIGLLRIELLVPIIALVLWFARRDLACLMWDLFYKVLSVVSAANRVQFAAGVFLVSAVAVVLFAVALFNVLYINNDNLDYITHYGPYYDLVITSHNTLPNDVWYQFFYSKGEGVGFTSMILTDRQGKQVSAFLCFLIACIAIFDLMRKEFKSSLWATAGVMIIMSIFAVNDAGSFEKHHAAVASVLVAITYSAYHFFAADENNYRIWSASGVISIMSLAILSAPAVAYAWIVVGGLVMAALISKRWRLAFNLTMWVALSGVLIVIVLAINYLVAGLPEITPFTLWLHWLDRGKFGTWASPHLLDYLVQGSSDLEKGSITTRLYGAVSALRLDKIASIAAWAPKVLLAASIASIPLVALQRKWPRELGILSLIAALFCVSVILGCIVVRQPVSVYRASFFSVFFVTPLVLFVPIYLVRRLTKETMASFITVCFLCIVAIKAIIGANHIDPQRIDARLSFLTGRNSLADAFALEFGVPPALYDLRYRFGKNDQWLYLRATNEAGLAHFIGRGIETEVSYSLGPKWHDIVYGEASQAKAELIRQGINYFLVQIDESPFGALPFCKLFQPQTLAQYMRVVDRAGSFVLLTWRDQQNETIDESTALFVKEWTKTLTSAPYRELYDRSRFVYLMKSSGAEDWIGIQRLPTVKGWQ
jgi:hypothetical protein